jgi:hypothetical protein
MGAGFRVCVTEDRKSIYLEMLVDGGKVGWADMEPPELDAIIEVLIQGRAELVDEVPKELEPGSRVPTIQNPIWTMPRYRLPSGRTLNVRHPGLGWVGFLFPEHEAREIANSLIRDLPIRDK